MVHHTNLLQEIRTLPQRLVYRYYPEIVSSPADTERLLRFLSSHRRELKKSKKIFFNDLGIRNALINDFRPIEIRNDAGALFENFMINEFRKQNEYQKIYANFYFWRNTDQREIDLVIEKNNQLKAIEIKWNPTRKTKLTKSFTHIYGETSFTLINRENFYEEIGGKVLSQFFIKTT